MKPVDFQGQGSRSRTIKPCKHDTDGTVSFRTVKLGTHTTYDKKRTPITFKVKGQGHMLNNVNVVKPCKHDTD